MPSAMSAEVEFLSAGGPIGNVGSRLMENDFDLNALRPFLTNDGSAAYLPKTTRRPARRIANSNATLRYDEWREVDRLVMEAARYPLRFWSDLVAASSYNIPNGLGVAYLTSQSASDPGSADISLDGNSRNRDDRQLFDLRSTPLPIISSGFSYSSRELWMGRRLGTPIDVSRAETAARRVAETLEDLALGVTDWSGMGGTIGGLTNYANRITATFTDPTDVGWTPEVFLGEVRHFKQLLVEAKMTGPFRMYNSSAWDEYFDEDYKTYSEKSLRQRLGEIDSLSAPRTVYGLSGFQIVIVQMTSNVIRAISGMPLTTLQWTTEGGWNTHFRVMTIAVPECRKDFYGKTGILHAIAA